MRKPKRQGGPAERVSLAGLDDLFLPSSQTQESVQTEQNENLLARPEMHMFLRPYFLLDKHADRMAEIETKEVVIVNGKQLERRWCVKPDREYGMPGALDRDVLLALYEIAYENYISKDVVVPETMPIGTTRAFSQRLGLTYSGRTAASIKQSLKRLVHTTCKSENSFFDKARNLFLTEAFQLLRAVGIAGESDGNGGVVESSFVKFDDRVRNNLNARYLMVIDLKYLRSLKTDIVKHLYPVLSHWLWRSSQEGYWRVEYRWLAAHLGIKVWDKQWRARQQLEAANEELKNKAYIAHYAWDGWHILYFPGKVFEAEQTRRAQAKKNAPISVIGTTAKPHPKTETPDQLIPLLHIYAQGLPLAEALLKQRGITEAQAEAMCLEKDIKINRQAIQ